MTDYQDLAERYIATWNEKDEASRRQRVSTTFTPEVEYSDPLAQVAGHEQLNATIAAVQQQFPDFVFRVVGGADGHHDQIRFTWELGPQGQGEAPVVGFDVATLDEQGRIARVLGFLDRAPG